MRHGTLTPMARDTTPRVLPGLDPVAIAAFQTRLLDWYATNGRDLPWRRTSDPYAILVSEVMLQQTQVARVMQRFSSWLSVYPCLERLAAASLSDVLRRWQGLGYNNRARRLHDCAQATVAAASGGKAVLPRTFEELLSLPGIGPYTARAVLVFARNEDVAAVDANVRRVLIHELRLDRQFTDSDLQAVAEAVLPRGRSRDWHNALMDYGSLVVTARSSGIPSRTHQGVFEGSRRWYRSRLLQTLLDRDTQRLDELAAAIEVSTAAARELVDVLENDGLVRRDGDTVSVA
jgi:A/G-specific adenine glycosylase